MADNSKNDNIVSFEFFKDQKKLDEDYPKFLGNAEKCFGAKTDPQSMMKRLYYTMRYLQGHINGLMVLFMLTGMTMEEQQKGVKYIIEWLEDILKDLKGFYNGYEKHRRTKS